ncbi:ATP-dependent helicase [Rothia sp. P6271]|uniref:ATP-dependent helicase n=1 Tax=Rothia sp. P6271 TaxID=3402659 RepID=UPI003ABE4757
MSFLPFSAESTANTPQHVPYGAPDSQKILENLDPEQRRVGSELDGPMCVLAGAGTGKTRAITHRIAYGIAIGRYVPQRVLALTFTARAADEMRLRLRALGADGVQARTFHSAALRQLRYFWPRAVGGTEPTLISHKAPLISEAAQRLRLSTDKATLRDFASEIEWAKVNLHTPDTLNSAIKGRSLPSGLDEQTMVRLFRAYEELKDERNMIDFEDVLLLTIGILEDDPSIAAEVHKQYRHFIVDEYQDVSPLQQRLLDAWLGDRDDLCVVGDASQTIYTFTGATSRYLLGFRHKYPHAHVVKLVRDYRSTPQVVHLANSLLKTRRALPDATPGRWAEPLELISHKPRGPEPQWFGYNDDEEEARGIAEDVQDLITKDGIAPSEIAVLFRTNSQSAAIEQAFNDVGVPYQLRGAEQFFSRPEVKNAYVQLRSAASSVESGSVVQNVSDILYSLGYTPQAPSSSGAVRQKWESLAALVSMAERMERERHEAQEHNPDLPDLTLQEFVGRLHQRMEHQDAPILNGVTLASLHSAKGLEWEAVFLAGMNEGLMPISYAQDADDIDEERRLLYVGITRAKSYLTLSWSRSRTPGGRGNRRRSRFLAPIAPVPE